MSKETKVPSVRQETENGSVNREVLAQSKTEQAGINFFHGLKYRHASNVIVMQNKDLEVYCTENKQTSKGSVLYFIISSIFSPPGITSTSGIKYHFIIATELHEFTEILHLSFYAQKCFWDTCYPISDTVFTGTHSWITRSCISGEQHSIQHNHFLHLPVYGFFKRLS